MNIKGIDIKLLREKLNQTQEEFGDLIGVSGRTIINYEKGLKIPESKTEILLNLWNKHMKSEIINSVKDPAFEYNKKLNQIHPDPNGKEIPYYETEVFATISPAMGDVVALKPDTFIRIPMFSQGQFALTVTGNSMKGFINHGDWVVIRQITDREEIIFGEPHLIVTKADNFKTVKFLKEGDSPDKFWLVPYNIEQFEPQQIKKSSVLELYRVIGVFKTV